MSGSPLDINASCFVFASAGSGKTKLLVDRYIKSLLFGIKPSEVLCLTFTNLAVDEMADRILKLLMQLKSNSDDYVYSYLSDILGIKTPEIDLVKKAKKLYDLFLDERTKLKIQTIHGFCQSILSEFPLEAGLKSGFRIIDQDELTLLIKEAKRRYFSTETHEHDVDVLISQLSGYSVNEFLLDIFINSAKYLHFYKINRNLVQYKQKLVRKFGLQNECTLSTLQQELINTLNDSLETVFLTRTGNIRKKLPFPEDKQSIAREIAEKVQFNYQNKCRKKVIDRTVAFLKVAYGISEQLELIKDENQVIDFNDVLEKTYLLLFHTSASEYVLSYITKRIKTVLLDEAQDLSSIQWRIIGIITERLFTTRFHNSTIFVVGDIKQSIYRFQNAHHRLFIDFYKYVQTVLKQLNKPLNTVYLDKCYRTVPEILKNVDIIFDKYGDFAFGQQYRHHIPVRKDKGKFQLINLFNATEIANYIKKNNITNGMILIRGKTELSAQLYYELIRLNVDVAPLDKIYLKNTLIIQDILSLARIAIDSTDEFEVACALRSPNVFKDYLSKTELHNLCYRRETTLLECVRDKYPEKYKVFETIINVYNSDNTLEFFSHIIFNVMQTYNTGEDSILESFIDIVVNYVDNYGGTIPEFLEYFAQSTQTIKCITHTHNLRFSTIHGAKGLEAENIVLLDFKLTADKNKTKFIWNDKTDIFGNTNPEENLFFIKPSSSEIFPEVIDMINKEYEEEHMELYRLLYVALTRPRNNIYIFGNNNNVNGVYSVIQAAITESMGYDTSFA